MTIRIPKPNIFDKFLYSIGKNRGVIISSKITGKYEDFLGKKESFWNAFFRPKKTALPKGMIDLLEIFKTR